MSPDNAIKSERRYRDAEQASVHQFMREGKTGGINDGDPGLYLHGEKGTVRVGEDDALRNPIEGGYQKRGVKQMSPGDQQDFQKIYDAYQQPRGVLAQQGPQLMGEYSSAMVG